MNVSKGTGARTSRHMRCYFGPVTPQASWYWVAADVAERLAGRLPVSYFSDVESIPDGAIVFWIKQPGSAILAEQVRRKKLVVLFFPVDGFRDERHIAQHRSFIDAARLICLHAHSLTPYFKGKPIAYVDHYNKYGIDARERRPRSKFLWIGAFQYVPYALSGLLQMRRRLPDVLFLTNLDNSRAREVAAEHAARINLPDFDNYLRDGTVEVQAWTEPAQRAALRTCRAAFDIKFLPDFNQRHKPPTKLQKYLCSGIPCAVNPGVPYLNQLPGTVELIEQLEARVASLGAGTMEIYAEELSRRLSLDRIADHYAELALLALDLDEETRLM